MKKYIACVVLLVLLVSCDNENANDCFQLPGSIVVQDFTVSSFSKIRVNRDVSLVLTSGATQKVTVETGENLINDVEMIIRNNQLIINDNNTCNLVRDYNITKVYITSPNIKEILSSTQFDISSNGVLNYPVLKIVSENFTDTSVIAVGNVSLQIDSQKVTVVGNNLTNFSLSGVTDKLNISFPSGNGILDAADLVANKVSFSHRGTNNIIVNPQEELSGVIKSTGDVVSKNHPPIVNVEALYDGELIFQN